MPFEADGYRFFGWGAYTNSDFDEAIEEENFELAEDTVLYAIWNKGYTDMFSGEDEIFLMRDGTGKAVLCRGGVDIEGSYKRRKNKCFQNKGRRSELGRAALQGGLLSRRHA